MLECVKTLGAIGMELLCFAYKKKMNLRESGVEVYELNYVSSKIYMSKP